MKRKRGERKSFGVDDGATCVVYRERASTCQTGITFEPSLHCQPDPTQIWPACVSHRISEPSFLPLRRRFAGSGCICPGRTRWHSRALRGLSAHNSHLRLIPFLSRHPMTSASTQDYDTQYTWQSRRNQSVRSGPHSVPRSKLLPFCFPPPYVLALGANGRGGGKPDTTNVCDPTFGGGVGTRNRSVRWNVESHNDANALTLSAIGRRAIQLRSRQI